ncbi:ABC transporter permease [Paracoccus saliphilus]|uniref:ABC transporter permease n=1 Tax=Paracoccus saliphilus TaxID=405559 RepID=A0AA46A506_9RHOB|nr:ABC transporter permease [Paracoccus saliphilus]WCR04955.1 ABC transporter permease [Paracoccus saliphilus]SIS72073.1 peptide/nickel transport system permease protein [Paracoccus saliphilus]
MTALPDAAEITGPTPGQQLRKRMFGHQGFMIGAVFLVLLVLVAIFAPVLAPHDPYAQSLGDRMLRPVFMDGTWDHPLGTDHLGRDYLSRLIYGARISLLIGAVAALISGLIGTALGVAAGYFGGRVDAVVTFLINVRLAMPVVLVALAVVAILGGSLNVVIGVLGLLLWDRFAVVMRASTLQIRGREFVAAARAIGCSTPRILLSEILPNIFNNLIVVVTLEMAHAILLEAALSFLGLGVQPPNPSWGLMVSEGKNMMLFEPWLVLIPGAVLFVLVLAINLMGDGLRDVTAPENRN